jgi:hypothetical protein
MVTHTSDHDRIPDRTVDADCGDRRATASERRA